MRKKVFKYIKFLVCVTLILSLVSPSFAALSAADGSAFVTKVEFDGALADFNSRLSTFEAGINSKIDSQVTSFLDKNGIWSGEEQDVSDFSDFLQHRWNHPMYWYLPYRDGVTTAGQKNWATYNKSSGRYIMKTKGNKDGTIVLYHGKLLNVKKSGLLVLTWGWRTLDSGGKTAKSASIFFQDGGTRLINFNWQLGANERKTRVESCFDGDADAAEVMLIDKRLLFYPIADATESNGATLSFLLGYEREFVSNVFVEKGDEIYLDIVLTICRGNNDTNFYIDPNFWPLNGYRFPTSSSSIENYKNQINTGVYVTDAIIY